MRSGLRIMAHQRLKYCSNTRVVTCNYTLRYAMDLYILHRVHLNTCTEMMTQRC
jgi:hypothetical protein